MPSFRSQWPLKVVVIVLSLTIMFILLWQVYKVMPDMNAADSSPVVGIITSDAITDQSWGSLAYEGKLRIMQKYDVSVIFASEKYDVQDMKRTIKDMIADGAELIIGHGREFSPVFSELAAQNKDVHFVTYNGYTEHNNQTSFHMPVTAGGYFSGYLAGMMTESGKVGLIEPFETNKENALGFQQAVLDINPDIVLYRRAVGNRNDELKAGRLARELINEGVDVIFTSGNAYNRAVIHEARQADVYVIGFLTDQSYMAEEHVLTSVVQDVPQGYVMMVEQFFSEEGLPSGDVIFDLESDIYGLTPYGPMVSSDVVESMEEQIQKYLEGELELIRTDEAVLKDYIDG